MTSPASFIAYPADPPVVGETIETAAKSLSLSNLISTVETWRDVDIAGRFIADQILQKISERDLFVADISVLNFNVTYEIGFAIGQKKRVILIRNESIDKGVAEINEIGIFDTIGWKTYQNSSGIVEIVKGCKDDRPLDFNATSVNRSAPVYLLDTQYKSDASIKVVSRIKKANLFFRSFDPNETNRMSAYEAIEEVAQSIGVIVSLLPKDVNGSRSHNLRASFLAGLTEGMGKGLAVLQLGEDPVPLDYRDLVKVCRHPEQIVEAVADFAAGIARFFQTHEQPVVQESRTFLEQLTLGATAAENEFRDLGAYYLETDAFARALRGDVRIILGRKGSGKTAMFAQVRDRIRMDRANIVVDLKPDGYKLLKFKEDVLSLLQEGTLEHTVMAFWEYVLLLEIAYKLLEKDEIPHKRNPDLFEPYRKLYDLYHTDEYVSEGDFSERMALLLESIRGDLAAKVSDSSSLRLSNPQITELLYKHDLKKLLENIKSYLLFKKDVWLLIDNIDRGWPTHGIQEEDLLIVRTLLDATRKIERDLSDSDTRCETVVFLRNDVYELLVGAMPDRGKEEKVLLDWTDPKSLEELIRRRLVFNDLPPDTEFQKIWRDIATMHVNGEDSFGFLVERCLMRPRALIALINHCRAFAVNRGHNRIETEDVEKGLEIYSRDLVQEISHELGDVFPVVADALYVFIGLSNTATESQLYGQFQELDIPKEHWAPLVDMFLWYGVLGYRNSDGEGVYIYSVNYDSKLLAGMGRKMFGKDEKIYCINPAFWSGLAIDT